MVLIPSNWSRLFQGPIADPNDGIDNYRDGQIDEPNEEIIMSKFVYYNNDFTVIGNPSEGIHFYNYLRGIWKDNVPMTFGGDGHGSEMEQQLIYVTLCFLVQQILIFQGRNGLRLLQEIFQRTEIFAICWPLYFAARGCK